MYLSPDPENGKKGGQNLRVGKEKVTLILYGMLFPKGSDNIPHDKWPIKHVLKITISKPGDRERTPPLSESRLNDYSYNL
jgi:hypothetical protein